MSTRLSIPMAAIALIGATLGGFANEAMADRIVTGIHATRAQVRSACESSGGTGYGTEASSGGYGCVTDNASIDCDAEGDCTGTIAEKTSLRRPRFGARLLPGKPARVRRHRRAPRLAGRVRARKVARARRNPVERLILR